MKRSHIETNLIRSIAGKTAHILTLDRWRVLAWLESPRMPLQTRDAMTHTHTHTPLYVPLHTSLAEPSPWDGWNLKPVLRALPWSGFYEVAIFLGAVLRLTFVEPRLQCGHRRRQHEMHKNILSSSTFTFTNQIHVNAVKIRTWTHLRFVNEAFKKSGGCLWRCLGFNNPSIRQNRWGLWVRKEVRASGQDHFHRATMSQRSDNIPVTRLNNNITLINSVLKNHSSLRPRWAASHW